MKDTFEEGKVFLFFSEQEEKQHLRQWLFLYNSFDIPTWRLAIVIERGKNDTFSLLPVWQTPSENFSKNHYLLLPIFPSWTSHIPRKLPVGDNLPDIHPLDTPDKYTVSIKSYLLSNTIQSFLSIFSLKFIVVWNLFFVLSAHMWWVLKYVHF